VFNVHKNWVPMDGTVVYQHYHPGKYLVAFHPKSSHLNERSTIVIEDEAGRSILIRQIAGLLARRIKSYTQPEQTVRAGSELGFIKFGSRVDIYLPPDYNLNVRLRETVKGGETILGSFEMSPEEDIQGFR
ncbi:MAG TPA: phosphatidylserine decarboxylase, partial [Aggregatilineales bacterium]|nr:phosphatidylserine decarboxylase [Aggregatilineales bacterium]